MTAAVATNADVVAACATTRDQHEMWLANIRRSVAKREARLQFDGRVAIAWRLHRGWPELRLQVLLEAVNEYETALRRIEES